MTGGWLDNLPDLWPGYPKKGGEGRSTPAKFYFPKFVDYPAVRRKLFDALKNDKIRRGWREASIRVSKESMECDEKVIWEEHRYLYLWTPNKSRLANDSDLLCFLLAVYHDQVCEFAPKVIANEIINLNLNMYRNLVKFAGWLDQTKLETLLEYAGDKGLLDAVSKPAKPADRRQSKGRRKTPPQLLRETRERQATLELVKNPNITAEKLGKILDCNKSTVTRLKAWQNKGVLDYDKPPKRWA